MKKGFTLLEVLVIAIVIGLLATFAMPQFVKIQEKSLDNEAKGYLVIMQAAEKVIKSEGSGFYGSSNHTDLNNYLDVTLPTGTGLKWNYSTKVTSASGSNPETVCAQAQRNPNGRYWLMRDTDDTPIASSSACP